MPTNDTVGEQNPKTDTDNARAQAQDEPMPSATKDKNIIIINQPRQSSAAWYLLPVFFLIIGGVISYFCLRKQDPSRARKTLIVGAVLSVIPILLLVVTVSVIDSEEFEDIRKELFGTKGDSVSETDMTDEQIKQGALKVPYASLMEEGERYEGEIIYYEGDVIQTIEDFNSYVLMVDVSDEPFESDAMWSNYDPETDGEEEWIEELRRKTNPFETSDRVEIWGVFTGLQEYETLLRAINTVPEVDVYILEKVQ